MSFTTTEKLRVEQIEANITRLKSDVVSLQTASNNFATKKELKNLLALLNNKIAELELELSDLNNDELIAHMADSSAHPNLDSYYPKSDYVIISNGTPDAGKPVLTTESGVIDSSLFDVTDFVAGIEYDLHHYALQGLDSDDHLQYLTVARHSGITGNPHSLTLNDIGAASETNFTLHSNDNAIHFTEASINHLNIQNIGANTHNQIDSHINDSSVHHTQASIIHSGLSGLSADDHSQYALLDGRSGTNAFTGSISSTTGIYGNSVLVNSGITTIATPTKTVADSNDYALSVTDSLNASTGSGTYTGIKYNLTLADTKTGWTNRSLLDLQVSGVSYFKVTDNIVTTSIVAATGALFRTGITISNSDPFPIQLYRANGFSYLTCSSGAFYVGQTMSYWGLDPSGGAADVFAGSTTGRSLFISQQGLVKPIFIGSGSGASTSYVGVQPKLRVGSAAATNTPANMFEVFGGTTMLGGDTLVSGVTLIAAPTKVTATSNDYALSITDTLNAGTGTGTYAGIKYNLTNTQTTGWTTVNLIDLQNSGVSQFSVNSTGNIILNPASNIVQIGTNLGITNISSGTEFRVTDTVGVGARHFGANTISTYNGLFQWILSGSITAGFQATANQSLDLSLRGASFTNSAFVIKNLGAGNYNHTLQLHPTMYVHSATLAASATNQWIGFTHNTIDGVIGTGKGGLLVSGVIKTTPTSDDYALLINDTLNASTGSGTYTGIKYNLTKTQAAGWTTTNLIDLQHSGVTQFSISDLGVARIGNSCVAGGNIYCGQNFAFGVTNRSYLSSAADGTFTVRNDAATAGVRLDFRTADNLGIQNFLGTAPGALWAGASTFSGIVTATGNINSSGNFVCLDTTKGFAVSGRTVITSPGIAQFKLGNSSATFGVFIDASTTDSLAILNYAGTTPGLLSAGMTVLYSGINTSNVAAWINGNLINSGQAASPIAATYSPASTTQGIDWNQGNNQIISLLSATTNVTLSFANPIMGAHYTLKIIQHSIIPRNLTYPSSVKWPDGIPPIVSVGSGAVDMVSMFYDGSNYYANCGQNYQ